MGYSLHANEVPFSIFRVSAAYLTSELAGRCGPMHIKQARGAEMICSGQSVCLPVLICTGGLDSIKDEMWFMQAHGCLQRGISMLMIDGAGAGWHAAPTQDRHPRRQRSADWQIASTGSNSAPTSIGSASPCADRASAATAPRVSRLHTRSSLSACRERMRSGPVMLRASARKLLLASIAGRIRNLAVGVPAASRATRRRQLHSGVP